jgi:hypothetical protein
MLRMNKIKKSSYVCVCICTYNFVKYVKTIGHKCLDIAWEISGPRDDKNVLVTEVITYIQSPHTILITHYDCC